MKTARLISAFMIMQTFASNTKHKSRTTTRHSSTPKPRTKTPIIISGRSHFTVHRYIQTHFPAFRYCEDIVSKTSGCLLYNASSAMITCHIHAPKGNTRKSILVDTFRPSQPRKTKRPQNSRIKAVKIRNKYCYCTRDISFQDKTCPSKQTKRRHRKRKVKTLIGSIAFVAPSSTMGDTIYGHGPVLMDEDNVALITTDRKTNKENTVQMQLKGLPRSYNTILAMATSTCRDGRGPCIFYMVKGKNNYPENIISVKELALNSKKSNVELQSISHVERSRTYFFAIPREGRSVAKWLYLVQNLYSTRVQITRYQQEATKTKRWTRDASWQNTLLEVCVAPPFVLNNFDIRIISEAYAFSFWMTTARSYSPRRPVRTLIITFNPDQILPVWSGKGQSIAFINKKPPFDCNMLIRNPKFSWGGK